MTLLNIIKVITPDSLRGIGRDYNSLSPQDTVIAGNCPIEISTMTGLKCFKIGRVTLQNAFALFDEDKIFYIYVNPKYRNYRKLFKRIVCEIPDKYHVDHLLSKNLAKHFNLGYVLLCMIPEKVNLRHGRFEKIKFDFHDAMPSIVYLDERIYNKLLSRNPTARQSYEEIIVGFIPISKPKYGLTLKQRGIWNSGFGFHKADKEFIYKNFIPLNLNLL